MRFGPLAEGKASGGKLCTRHGQKVIYGIGRAGKMEISRVVTRKYPELAVYFQPRQKIEREISPEYVCLMRWRCG